MRKILLTIVILTCIPAFALMSPDLIRVMSLKDATDLIPIDIVFKEQMNINELKSAVEGMTRPQKRVRVAEMLREFSAQRQRKVLVYLTEMEDQGKVTEIKSFWINNAIFCRATKEVIEVLHKNDKIYYVDYDYKVSKIEKPGHIVVPADKTKREITYGVSIIRADQVWGMGYTGTGIIVGLIDTGVNYNHLDLRDHMWTDPNYPFHGWDFEDNDPDPMDNHGHGTHTAGTIASNGTAGTQCGVAPEAHVMALKVRNVADTLGEQYIWDAMQFSISPPASPANGADLISMSMGWLYAWNPRRATWRTNSDNVGAAGLVMIIAAGNEGGGSPPDNLRCPGDVPPPWWNPQNGATGAPSDVVSIGATDSLDQIASFSSRGPITWQSIPPFNDYSYPPGCTRPDVSAPGVNVKSCALGDTAGYTSMSGTSMATPHTAGLVCLMLSKTFTLTPLVIDSILETTAVDLGPAGKDNDFGAGRIDAVDAINATQPPYLGVASTIIDDTAGGNGDGVVNAGETIDYGIYIKNYSANPAQSIYGLLSLTSPDPYVTINTDSAWYGDIAPDDSALSSPYYNFDVDINCPDDHMINFTLELHDINDTIRYAYPSVRVIVPYHNMQADSFTEPSQYAVPEFTTITPTVKFTNIGDYDENNIPVTCRIDLSGSPVYTSNRTITFLAMYAETLITFDNFTLDRCGSHYQAFAFSTLASDTFFTNDTVTFDFTAARLYEVPTPGCLAWKYPNADSGVVPVPTNAGWIPATPTEIQQISVLDSDWWVTAGATDTVHQDLQMYMFQLDAADTLIEQLTVEWWGHHGATLHDRCALYFWNDQANAWSRRLDSISVPSDVHLTSTSYIDSAAMFVNNSNVMYVSTGADLYVMSCCPLLFTFNGEKNVFIGDFISGSDMGTWVGQVLGQNIYLPPDYDEYVKIDEENLACVDGKYRITVNEMLQEVTYLDEAKLYVVDHPTDYDIYPHEALLWPGYEGLTLYASKERPLKAAHDALGRDILYTLTQADRIYVPFEKLDITGFTKPFEVILDVGELSNPSSAILYLYGSTRFPDAGWIDAVSDIYKASKQGLKVKSPKLEVIDEHGRWQEVSSCGMPAGHKKTVTYPLYDDQGISIFKSQDHRIRLSLTQEVYLDKAWVSCAEQDDYQLTELMPSLADLHYYGYAAYTSADGKYPGDFCYESRVAQNHANVVGYYTKYGDVSELLNGADSRFVVMCHGDEIALEFDAADLPELRDGWTRDFIFAAKGFYKMARPGRAYAYSVEPLPFYGMREDLSAGGVGYYPYDPSPNLFGTLLGRLYAKLVWDYPFTLDDAFAIVKTHLTGQVKQAYPENPELVAYRQTWNTRHVGTFFPKLYADLPPHVNSEGVPLCEVEGDWTSHLASLGIPFGDHSLHSNYVRLWMVTTVPVGIEELKALVPTQFSFSIGYPNPFRSATTMRYTIPFKTEVHLDIYDATGRLVRRLVDDTQKPGAYSMRWDRTDARGLKCASGIYFVKFEAGDYMSTKKAVLLK